MVKEEGKVNDYSRRHLDDSLGGIYNKKHLWDVTTLRAHSDDIIKT